ncbi:Putative uncharacterized protein [Taphrina deformans PYCC 5710]|uniref:Glutamyl-tRNA amidotransferase complex subunit Gta3 domain-containing protein n=1 Tax=Taphrina deformans (strain PYCC 5710 / ATCC 11124 / CBS 356.35 / IMI 108563 / JCM 9778 / NBRC 8474) TaxID=1097556 RepID=R4XEJ1_TAPDE|nr:Putative uncharacterized protein [Taphrina deformans PYCC 5710]|eukprot:CCG81787.1 Putative uncharacterized protein [Taphrina deformans PYCC 5710]
MLPPKGSGLTEVEPISASQLDHLLKLSALPQPKDPAARASMMKDLTEQMHFVKAVQDVDTSNTLPLHNLTAEQEDEGGFTYEEAVAEGQSLRAAQAGQAETTIDYTKLAARTINGYYTVDGGLVTDADEKQK